MMRTHRSHVHSLSHSHLLHLSHVRSHNSLRVIIAPTVSASQVQLEQISFVRVPIVTCSCVGACRERDGARRPVRAAAGDRVDEPQEHGRAPLPASHSTRVPRIQPTPSYPLTTILDLAFE